MRYKNYQVHLIAASRDLGATPWQTLKNVVIPLTMSGVRSGVQAVFIPSLFSIHVNSFNWRKSCNYIRDCR